MAGLCHALLASTFLAFLLLKHKSSIEDEAPEPPGFDDSLIPPPPEPQICTSQDCVIAAAYYHTNMNTKVKPCEDFSEFTCGNYHLYHDIAPGQHAASTSTDMNIRVKKQLKEALLLPVQPTDQAYEQLAKMLFQECMDTKKIDSKSTQDAFMAEANTIFDNSVPIFGQPVFTTSWEKFFAKVQYNIGDEFPILCVSTFTSGKDSSKTLIRFNQPEVWLIEDHSAYDRDASSPLMIALTNTYVEILRNLGFTDTANVKTAVEQVLQFEKKLVESLVSDTSDPGNMYNYVQLSDLNNAVPGLDLKAFIDDFVKRLVTVPDDAEVILSDLEYFKKLQPIISNEPKEVIANYLALFYIKLAASFVNKEVREPIEKYLQQEKGVSNTEERLQWCVTQNKDYLPLATASVYINEYFDLNKVVSQVTEITDYLLQYVEEEIKASKWLDDPTRNKAVAKVHKMAKVIGYPKYFADKNKMKQKHRHFGSPVMGASFWSIILGLGKAFRLTLFEALIHTQNKEDSEYGCLAEVNAIYSPSDNSIVFFPAILQYPFFLPDAPRYVNFGAIGSAVGHEIQHAFDTRGRNYDETGASVDWWTPTTNQHYQAKAQCFIDQYTREGVDGQKTVGENIADNAGAKTAFGAYKRWIKDHPEVVEMKLPGFEEYTEDQMFWIVFANIYCSVHDAEALAKVDDVHSPDHIRLRMVPRNNEEAGYAFNCPKGSKTNPTNKCTLW